MLVSSIVHSNNYIGQMAGSQQAYWWMCRGIDSSLYYLSVLNDSKPLRGHEKEQREAFYFEI